jgi:hypothetical protein
MWRTAPEFRRTDRASPYMASRASPPDDPVADCSASVIGKRIGRTFRHRSADKGGLVCNRGV